MAELSNIAAELSKGKKPQENLIKYANGMMNLYGRISDIKLALNLYAFAQNYGEDDGYSEVVKGYAERLAELIQYNILDNASSQEGIDAIDSLRNEFIAVMEILTSYVDRFSLFEYILNRIEFRYKEHEVNPDYYNDMFEKDILKYLQADSDNTVINMKIGQIVGQLPMRLSKNKFYDILRNTFTLYKGGQRQSLDDFVYMIKSESMLIIPDGFDDKFPFLKEQFERLMSFNYSELDEEGYNQASDTLYDASNYVNNVTDLFVMLMDSLNDAYTNMLSGNNVLTDAANKADCRSIICEAVNSIKEKRLPSEEVFPNLVNVEGIQEKLFMQLSKDGYAMDDVKNSFTDEVLKLGLSDIYEKLFKMELLNSGSGFVSLETVYNEEIVDEALVLEVCEKTIEELKGIFEKNDRIMNRAVMASILEGLPTFFNNKDELLQYIHVALSQCKDEAERQGCMVVMRQLMEE